MHLFEWRLEAHPHRPTQPGLEQGAVASIRASSMGALPSQDLHWYVLGQKTRCGHSDRELWAHMFRLQCVRFSHLLGLVPKCSQELRWGLL